MAVGCFVLRTKLSPLPALLLLVAAGCAGAAPEPSAPGRGPAVVAPRPNVGGAAAEGTVERRAPDAARGTHVLRGDRGEILYVLESTPPPNQPELALGPHEGQRVNVTGVIAGDIGGVPLLSVRSLVVTRGGEFDRVIAVIARLRCADASFAEADRYRLDALHSVREDRFPVHVQTSGGAFTVWVRRRPELPEGYVVDEVLRAAGKDLTRVCQGAPAGP